MKLSITGHHIEITPAIRTHVENKMKIPGGHFQGEIEGHVVLTHESTKTKTERNKAEINAHVRGKVMHASAHHSDMYAAIDEIAHKIDKQIEKYKGEKKFTHDSVRTNGI